MDVLLRMDDYDKILAFYNREDRTEKTTLVWCNEYLVNLMQLLREDPNNIEAENCINFIMNLFFIKEPDDYHSKGKTRDKLSHRERKIFFKQIRNIYYDN